MHDDVKAQLVALLPRLRRFALGLARGQDQADDLVQAGLERALARLGQWQPGTRLDSWMFRIMQTIWIDQRRRLRIVGEPVPQDEVEAVAGPDGRVVVENNLVLAEVRRAVALLPDDQRLALALVVVDGLSYKEAAVVMEVPIGTVMSRLARARQRLARSVEGEEPGRERAS